MHVAGRKRRVKAATGFKGSLTKQGRIIHSWKKRYFTLTHGVLNYFESEKESHDSSKSLGDFHLPGSTCSDVDEHGQLHLRSHDRSLVVKSGCDDPSQSIEAWRQNILLHIDICNEDLLLAAARDRRVNPKAPDVLPPGISAWLARLKDEAIASSLRLRREPQLFIKRYPLPLFAGTGRHTRLFTMTMDGLHLLWSAPGSVAAESAASATDSFAARSLGVVESGKKFVPPKNAKALPVSSLSSIELVPSPDGRSASLSVRYNDVTDKGGAGGGERVVELEATDRGRAAIWASDVETVAYFHALFRAWESRRATD